MGMKENIKYLSGIKYLKENDIEEKELSIQAGLLNAFDEFIKKIKHLRYKFEGPLFHIYKYDESTKKKKKKEIRELKKKMYKFSTDKMKIINDVLKETFSEEN